MMPRKHINSQKIGTEIKDLKNCGGGVQHKKWRILFHFDRLEGVCYFEVRQLRPLDTLAVVVVVVGNVAASEEDLLNHQYVARHLDMHWDRDRKVVVDYKRLQRRESIKTLTYACPPHCCGGPLERRLTPWGGSDHLPLPQSWLPLCGWVGLPWYMDSPTGSKVLDRMRLARRPNKLSPPWQNSKDWERNINALRRWYYWLAHDTRVVTAAFLSITVIPTCCCCWARGYPSTLLIPPWCCWLGCPPLAE